MFVVDVQVHVYEASRPDQPWEPSVGVVGHRPELLAEDLVEAMDQAGVDRTVLVPPGWVGYNNQYSLDAVRRWPGRFAVMGRIDPSAPDAPERLATWLDQPGMVGIRFVLARDPWRRWAEDGTLDWFWPRAEELGIPVAVWAHGVLGLMDRVAGQHPDLKLLLCHAGLPVHYSGDPLAGLGDTLAFARHPNVYVKLTGMPDYSTGAYPFRDIHEPIRRIFDAFGPRRLLWGTDFTRMACTYREAIDLFAEALDFLSEDDRAWILGRTAAEVLRWPIPGAAVTAEM